MKKIILIIPVLLILAATVNAQEFYMKTGLGYALPHGTQPYDAYGNPYGGSITNTYNASTGSATSFKVNKPSLTAGVNGTIGLGIMVNKHIGIEIAANIGIANKKYELQYDDNDGTERTMATVTQQAKTPVLLVPALLLQSGDKLITLYTRAGIVVPINTSYNLENKSTTTNLIASPNTTDKIVYNEQYKTRFGIGFSGAVGGKYKLAEIVSVFAEINVTALSLYAKSSEVTEYMVNGVNYTTALPNEVKTSNYELEASNINNTNSYPTFAIPYSNFGFTAGVFVSIL